MDEKDKRHSQDSHITEAAGDGKPEHSLSDSESSAMTAENGERSKMNETRPKSAHNDNAHRSHPDIDHLEVEAATPGHNIDVELGQVSHRPSDPRRTIILIFG